MTVKLNMHTAYTMARGTEKRLNGWEEVLDIYIM